MHWRIHSVKIIAMSAVRRTVTYHQIFHSNTYLRTYNRAYKSFMSGTSSSFPRGPMKFFIRTDEVKVLQDVLKAEMQFSLIMGPVHSDKSTLLTEVLDRLGDKKAKTYSIEDKFKEWNFSRC